ncbi:LysR family transcriptional regulator [Rudaeicoccus suwonensis]|uniref:DNA-binding transcriptional LysR family regulator n=1 Tax=Rudaeicoccus suwonensis TaxID=657409 RepID=A0A561E4F0_9MICO|nr:LysR family transcriptional regulator [Rudaeicoccus suwonensis]TWE10489.1 DNA-binding transcriptional LysR family regulator [Rudaeicoccus suwonensis]
MLDLLRLRTLQRFGEFGTISATAAALGYTPSAVSQQLAGLEREMGTALIERTARSASLTPAGRALVARSKDLLALAEDIESELAHLAGTVTGRLVITTIPNLAAVVATSLISLQADHPGLDLTLKESSAETALLDVTSHRSDLAVIDSWASPPASPPEGLRPYLLHTDPIHLTYPATAGRYNAPQTREELAQLISSHVWISAPRGHGSRIAGDHFLEQLQAEPLRRWEFEGLLTIADLVSAEAGVALLPELVTRAHQERLGRTTLPRPMNRRLTAVTRHTAQQQPAITAAISSIRHSLRNPSNEPHS